MSKFLDQASQETFDDEVKHNYQGNRTLAGTVREKHGVKSETHHFRRMGKGMAKRKTAPASNNEPMNISHAKVPCTMTNWTACEYTDIFDDAMTNVDERMELAYTIGSALGRREDQFLIDSLASSPTYAGTVATSVGGTDTDLNPAKLRRAIKYLLKKGVKRGNITCVHTADQLESMLGYVEVTSSDYQNIKALIDGEVTKFLGINMKLIEDRDEGGVPVASTVRDCFVYDKIALGAAWGIDPQRAAVDWIPEKSSWFANGLLRGGGTAIDGDGIVKVQCKEPA